MRLTRGLLLATWLVVGCTPIGAWLYDDPSFSLRSATLRPAPGSDAGPDSLDLVFASCNRNDFDMLGEMFESSLTIEGRQVGQGHREQPYFLTTRDTSQVTITLALSPEWGGSARQMRFELASALLLKAPTGDRRIDILQKGTLIRGDEGLTIRGNLGVPCRPGGSRLPGEFTRRVPLGPPIPELPPQPAYAPGSP